MLIAPISPEDFSLFAQIESLRQIQMHPVQNSAVSELGYCQTIQTLQVHLVNGEMRRYFDVPWTIAQQCLTSSYPLALIANFDWEVI